jgi:diguanylate cyclase (GGDEF)-like protein/PAS domain S-box-containing protein
MPVLETLTIAAGLGAFAFLAYYVKRRLATRGIEETTGSNLTAADSGQREAPARPKQIASRGPDHPLAVMMEQGLFENLADSLDAAVLIHDKKIHYANASAARIFAVPVASLKDSRLEDYVHPEQRDALKTHLERRFAGNATQEILTVQLIDAEDRSSWVEIRPFQLSSAAGTSVLGSVIRPSPAHALEEAREAGRSLARRTLDAVGEGIITTDLDGKIDYVNGAAELMIGCRRDMAVGRVLNELVNLVDEADRRPLGDPVARCLEEGARIDLGRRSLLVALTTGDEHSIELSASPIRSPDREYLGTVVLLHDVSEIRGLARQMSYQASHDPLTGLANRREFERRLQDSIDSARSGSNTHVLCYLDLDRFKVVNDSCGHMAGDNLLREVAGLIRQQVRDSDSVARIGGDEFGMLLTGCPLEKARQIADDVCNAIRDYRFVWRDRIFTVGVSIGLLEISHEAGSIDELMGAADSACYVAKQKGRGRVHVYSARDEAVARQRGEILWLQRIQKALKEDRFELYLQPIVSVSGRVDTGPAYEVLLRMRGDDGATISPVDFMQAAERYHLMPNVDRWVLQSALSAIGSGTLKLPDQRSCTINLSGQTIGDPQFLDFVVDCLDRSGVAPTQICFEVREASIVANLAHAGRFIAVLHGMGCEFAMDDFGSGLGAFSNLKSLAMDYLKIDGAIIRGLDEDEVNQAMVSAMISLARTMDIRVVAEHVETDTVFETVRRMGVDFAQGYAVGRPEPLKIH